MAAYVRAAALANFVEVSRDLGLNANQALREVGLDPRILNEMDQRISAEAVVELLDNAARQTGCETFGLRMVERRQLANFGATSLLITHQPTLRDVVATISQYRHLLNESLAAHVEDCGDTAILREVLLVQSDRSLRQAYDLAIGVLFLLVKGLFGDRWRPLSINFSHSPPQNLSLHRKIFGVPLVFDSDFNGIVCAASDLDRPNPAAHPALAQYARQFLDTLPFAAPQAASHETRKMIYLLMPIGGATIERVSHSLGLNVRTLQRRLAEDGEEFSALVNGVRRDLAVRYLANRGYPLTHVGQLLGYGQLSSFTRWFIAQFGVTPSQWRRERRADGSGGAGPDHAPGDIAVG